MTFPISDSLKQTDANLVTYPELTNEAFLTAIFGPIDADAKARPLVCAMPGDPHKGPWKAQPLPTGTEKAGLNWYAAPALFSPDSEGVYRAQKQYATAVYCVVLDDVGTKIPLEQLDACAPTWLLETSPGNHQAGYLFEQPLTDLAQADALKASLIDAGLCDPGASGAAARWFRLPVGINGKPNYGQPSPHCRLVDWNPELRYTPEDLVLAFGLKPVVHGISQQVDQHNTPVVSEGVDAPQDDVYSPKPAQHPVLAALKAQGLYKSQLGPGKHDITCPWVHEHTDAKDHGTAYFEASDLFPRGGFKCQHAHGSHYHLAELLKKLSIEPEAAQHRSSIQVVSGELHRVVEAAERELAATGRYFQRGGAIVTIHTDTATQDPQIQVVSQAGLQHALSRLIHWERVSGQKGELRACDPPLRHVKVLLEAGHYRHLPVLNGLARQPFLAEGGRLVLEAGYDKATGIYAVFDASRYSIPLAPTLEDAMHALKRIRELLSEFVFASVHDEMATVAAILTAAMRPSLPTAPLFHIKAASYGSGKSYLSTVISAFCGPDKPTILAFPGDETECQKLLISTLKAAPAVVVFDNLTDDLPPYKSLCTALTEEHMTGRELGVSRTATVGTRTLFLSSGNNVDAMRDMGRRTITIILDPQVENPASRHFDGDPLRVMRERREDFVSYALTIVRAWMAAGSPEHDCPPMNSFEQWSKWVRQPLLWLGQTDPAVRSFEQQAQDPERELLGRFLHAWRSVFGRSPTMIREAVNEVMTGTPSAAVQELREVIKEIAEDRGEINHRRLGKWISRHQGRIVNGMKFVHAAGTFSAARWGAQSVTEVSSVSKNDSESEKVSEVPF